MKINKPPLYAKGKTLFLTSAYPPNPAAASVVHTHLLNQFDPGSFVVLKGIFPGARKTEHPKGVTSKSIYISFEFLSTKIHKIVAWVQRFTIPSLLSFYYLKYKPALFIIAYPDLYWLDLCSKYAINKGIPFVPYLHDTVVEGVYSPAKKAKAKEVQNRIFKNARAIAVMSEGIRALYHTKYGLHTIAWEHIYEEVASEKYVRPKIRRIHWSGDVYEINHKSVKRVSDAAGKINLTFSLSNGKTKKQLSALGINGNNMEKVFYPDRKDYLRHLDDSLIVLLGLNWSDECIVERDELSTIFSTKTPEYLASNALIIYHGPGDYFLAKFLKQHECGVVIDTRDSTKVYEVISDILDNYERYISYVQNAKRALSIFRPEMVRDKVQKSLAFDE